MKNNLIKMENDNKPLNLLDEGTLREYIKNTVRSTVEEMLLCQPPTNEFVGLS